MCRFKNKTKKTLLTFFGVWSFVFFFNTTFTFFGFEFKKNISYSVSLVLGFFIFFRNYHIYILFQLQENAAEKIMHIAVHPQEQLGVSINLKTSL